MKLYNLLPESASAPEAARKRYFNRTMWPGFAAIGVVVVFVNNQDTVWAGVLVAALIPLMFIYLAYEFIVLIKAMDELQRQIHILAIALSGAFTALILSSIGLSLAALEVDLWLAPFAFPGLLAGYYIALLVIAWRYR